MVAPVSADDRRSIDETKAASSEGFVQIKVVRGSLAISGWDKNAISVSGLLDEEVKEFIFDVSGDNAEIAVKLPRRTEGWDDGSDLDIRVPKGSRVDVSVVSADVRLDNIKGGLELGSVSGEITARDVHGRVEIASVSGEVEVRNASGKISAKSVSGDVEADSVSGEGTFHTVSGDILLNNAPEELDLESVSGDIEVEAVRVVELRGHSISGDTEISVALAKDGIIEFDNISGGIRLKLPSDTSAHFSIETGSGGDIRNRITNDEPKVSKYIRDQSLRFVLQGGAGEVELSTASGDITITD